MGIQSVTLDDRFDLGKSTILMNGTQALVRLMLMQKARDRAAGLNTAGLVTGYRGSPLGAVDMQMTRARKHLEASDIVFQPGLNEDLAATALWGSQTAELRGEGKFDGVFGLWYGKGPGVDRTGDVFRHVNMAGTSQHGGVLVAMGDDHTGESSTTCHQSDWALVDAHAPVLSPAGVQEILDLGLYGLALSRFAGVWVGLKLMKDTVEATAVVDGRPDRMQITYPEFEMPKGGLNIRLGDHWIAQEERLLRYKRFAAEAFAGANGIDRRMHGKPGAKIGFVAAGKNWLDLLWALDALGIDGAEAERLGVTTYKVGQTWPLDMKGFKDWAEGLELIVVVEEKRKLIEVQVKEAIFDDRRGRRVFGYKDGQGDVLFQQHYSLDPTEIALKLGRILTEEGRGTDRMAAGMARVEEARRANNAPELATRTPYFCSGCPHNTSTRVPEGAVAGAGIGCHFMAKWMDRSTEAYTHMGGEGANWIGEAPFSKRKHVFQNLGEGTYNHSGILAIRAAVAARANITYKILFNDAVAMTGGQHNEGDLDPARIAHEVRAMGVKNIALVYDPKEEIDWSAFPRDLERFERDDLMKVQERFQDLEGTSAIIYIQTCAAEKRRRRKRGTFPDIDRGSSSTPMSARAAAIAGCSRTASPSCRRRPSLAASAPSTSPPATRISPASRGSAPPS
jgi:indolepyruvate ferredoxin oxidoreductase